ncbi:hypothetical protein E1B28_004849 [Marasmius oreades]|uniref:NADP-dependent oxidoreductase domain-containing protein n=1 Tax=Marasmius oreades TaxID=181124 RepID=A0A9P7UZH1_9AGAR|nr:uncharacterized protein E1B28_004849 [Marasmius oreades]KAG7097507.1 hypothetical protein E1B28_004849 [Marasmius oreades]
MHWPQAFTTEGKVLTPDESPTFVETWSVMEKLVESGKTKSIGVSNFSVKTLEILLRHAKLIPVANQVELHPCLPQHALLKYCISRGILLTAYSPLGKYKIASDPDIVAIADRMTIEYGEVSPAQVMLSWGVQRGTAVIPRTLHEERMKQNMRLLTLSDEDMHVLDGLHLKPGMHRSVCGFHSSDLGGSCFGWTYDMLGWDMVEGGIMRDLTD